MKIYFVLFLVIVSCKSHISNSSSPPNQSDGLKTKQQIIDEQVTLFTNMLNDYKATYGQYPNSLTAVADLEAAGYEEVLKQLQDPYYPGTIATTAESFNKYPKIYAYINLEEMADTVCQVTQACNANGHDLATLKSYGFYVISRGGDFDFEFEDPNLSLPNDAQQIFMNIMNYVIRTIHDPAVIYTDDNHNGDIIYTNDGNLADFFQII